jgi:hypothetical protein
MVEELEDYKKQYVLIRNKISEIKEMIMNHNKEIENLRINQERLHGVIAYLEQKNKE